MYPRSITDMCCCELVAAVAHLLPVLNSSCLCFVAPKQGPDSGPKKRGHNIKISSPASQFLGPWYMRFSFCKERIELRQVASFIHVFLRLVPGCWFHSINIYIYNQLNKTWSYPIYMYLLSIIRPYLYIHTQYIYTHTYIHIHTYTYTCIFLYSIYIYNPYCPYWNFCEK